MPRWKALPDELDPQVREFAGQLRRLIDRSGLSIAAVADRTGYSKTSWERYLNGRLLAPKGAIVALAEATDTDQVHLTTMWEVAERAWSRAEMRHDMTMEGIRIAQARAALGEFGPSPVGHGGSRRSAVTGAVTGTATDADTDRGAGGRDGGRAPSVPIQRGTSPRVPQQSQARPGAGYTDTCGSAAGGRPPQPPQPQQGGGPRKPVDRRKLTVFLAGVVGALMVIAAAVLLTGPGGDDNDRKDAATPSASPSPSAPELPDGVRCSGADCTGKDPEDMGCGGRFANTAASVTVGGSLVEVRYSETCAAAWARITRATPGDTVRITAGAAAGQRGAVDAGTDTDAYTPMVAVKKAADARACATLASGTKGCTTEAAG
ncbi:XRE family transcriptional regulator [Streptomyces sp. NBC_00154]|uniref:XRE family transcriptional regulator n=1 Tax=Streptomyces sp. NBC_00154 TaxID=2975670 RepID=UPI0022540660|nr:XRE family transcriptional regulator [Streptomyces sp. NBC_00154]MCX5311202.1 XRE family transcriptional regulator [Streptomyces sp. NBC_00154]